MVNGRARISGDMAIRLAKAFGSTTETWIRLQAAYDVVHAQSREDQIEAYSSFLLNAATSMH